MTSEGTQADAPSSVTFSLTDEQRVAFQHARTNADARDGVTLEQLVAAARKHFATARAMKRHRRLGHYQGRNGGGGGAEDHEREAMVLLDMLLDLPGAREGGSWQRKLLAGVCSDHDLSIRLQIARENGQDRPELRCRQNRHRREIRELVGS